MDFLPQILYYHPVGMCPSLVGHCVRDAGVARSNRAIPTIYLLEVEGQTVRRSQMPEAIWKMGRYIAMIIPPTTPPRKTIMTGSRRDVMADTAASTSSS